MIVMLVAAGLAVGASIVVPMVMQRVVDGPVRHHDPGGLIWFGLAALALGALEALMVFLRRWTQSYASLSMEADVRDELYGHMQKLPLTFHDRWQSGQLLSRAITDIGVIRRFLSFGVIYLIVNVCQYVVVVVLLIRLYWPLGTLVALSAVPLFLISRGFARRFLTVSRQVQDSQGDLATYVEESAHGIRVIKAFGRRHHMFTRFTANADRVYGLAVERARLDSRFAPLYELIPNLSLAVIVVVGAVAVVQDHLTLGQLVAFATLQMGLVWPVESLGWILATGQEAMTAADRIYDVFDTEPTVVDRPGAVDVDRASVTGAVRFEGVRFGYPEGDRDVLAGIDLDIAPGETMALVGVTGSGKTTLVSLVPRLYDVTGGRITLDGRDVREYTLDSLRRTVATAFEEPILFSMSVRENLALGRPDATDAELAEALRVAQAEFVYELPWGLDTRVGEQGLSLSGGQRQRLALARAVVSRPKVLVLDDPLSALDVNTEALVEEALARVLAGTTALLVVHRPSTVALADRVALLEDGRITAVGTHSELLATVPSYRAVLSATADEDEDLAGWADQLPEGRGVAAR
ncbi:ABC transporter ATP-binding protein [Actinocatenispora rupis]|uniref:ABC transporter ATP-binding protein n=2 Tax=Actinocatenispora rupis TaxID=519421 RepID=A0A8J3NB67_9ACTN|nr:ABC transporter ATP-binding protein [Actinocatenispora rupis]GID10460.1 ABC transporter ATP-binding protein [Actinocatenispora rupis]